jgi:hypothetical protein
VVDIDFVFKNNGKTPIIISGVETTCGCTTPDWSKMPILAGQTGYIKVQFDPKNRPGPFEKTITVKSNATPSVKNLIIKGNVNPSLVKKKYFYNIGDLNIKTLHENLGEIKKGEIKSASIPVINYGKRALKLAINEIPSHIDIEILPKKVKKGRSGEIKIEYNSNNIDDWDYTIDRLFLDMNGKSPPKNRITITAKIVEDFSGLTPEEITNAPEVRFMEKKHDFGKISTEYKVEHNFTISNAGKSDLIIRKIRASCGCTAITPQKTVLLPGESTQIKAIFNPENRSGTQTKSVTVITNDPKNYKTLLWIFADVKSDTN